MRASKTILAILASLLILGLTPSPADGIDSSPTFYVLEEQSDFETGCFGPCKCPVRSEPLQGRFELKHTGFDGLYDTYEVTNVKWQVRGRDPRLDISGSGKYRVGGEFAVQHQLSLDLRVGDHSEQHFDSGIVPGGGTFPQIDIAISVHGMQTCLDTVIHVRATPAVAGVDHGLAGSALQGLRPNPFAANTDIDFSLRVAGPVGLAVYDAQGRAVRSLVGGGRLPAGPHSLRWDGRRDDGAQAGPGLYFVRLRAPDRDDRRAIVKLE